MQIIEVNEELFLKQFGKGSFFRKERYYRENIAAVQRETGGNAAVVQRKAGEKCCWQTENVKYSFLYAKKQFGQTEIRI